MQITKQYVTELILEELTKSDVKDIVDAAIEKQLKKELPKAVKEELEKALKAKETANVIVLSPQQRLQKKIGDYIMQVMLELEDE